MIFLLMSWSFDFHCPKFSVSKGLMGIKSNNNSSTYGISKTYSGRKTRDCKQMEEL